MAEEATKTAEETTQTNNHSSDTLGKEQTQGTEGLLGGGDKPTPASPSAGFLNSSGEFTDKWTDYLKNTVGQDIAEAAEAHKYKSVGELAKAYVHLNKAFSKRQPTENMVELPQEGMEQEKIDAFYNKLGRPEKPEGYTVPKVEGLSEELVSEFSSVAHKLGLTDKQFQSLVEFDIKRAEQYQKSMQQDSAVSIERAKQTLRSMFGEQHDFMMTAAKRVLEDFDVDNFSEIVNNDYRAVAMLANIGKKLYQEDDIKGSMKGVNKHDILAEINKIRDSGAYFNAAHPDNKAAVQRVRELQEMLR